MSSRLRRVAVVAAFALTLAGVPGTSLAYPFYAPQDPWVAQGPSSTNPLRSLLNVFAQESASLFAALQDVYSSAYVSTDCTQLC